MYFLSNTVVSLKAYRSILGMWLSLWVGLSMCLSGCDTGFGEPCSLPQTPQFAESCQQSAVARSDDENNPEQEFKATCAIDNYPTCQTFSCLTYRGSQPYCSMKCLNNSDCEGGCCCPLFGDCECNDEPAMMSVDPGLSTANDLLQGPKYCIRRVDLNQ